MQARDWNEGLEQPPWQRLCQAVQRFPEPLLPGLLVPRPDRTSNAGPQYLTFYSGRSYPRKLRDAPNSPDIARRTRLGGLEKASRKFVKQLLPTAIRATSAVRRSLPFSLLQTQLVQNPRRRGWKHQRNPVQEDFVL